MNYKVAELDGPLLDAAVAKAEGWTAHEVAAMLSDRAQERDDIRYIAASTSWGLGGPIIERERIATLMLNDQWCAWMPGTDHPDYIPSYWLFSKTAGSADGRGPTLLIAAMRAYVASKFGDEVELP